MHKKIIIGIDPDIEKNGYAVFHDKQFIKAENLTFFEMTEKIKKINKLKKDKELHVVIERGESNSAIYNAYRAKNKQVAAKIGVNVGKNFAVSDLLIQFCEHFEISYSVYVPASAKWTSKFVSSLIGLKKSNQEQRDAIRCCFSMF